MEEEPLFYPATERNRGPILEQLRKRLPQSGTVLEIASGSGQHVAYFAEALPHLDWQPTDIDPKLFGSIRAHVSNAGLSNVADPIELDVTRRPWPIEKADVVLCSNMIHISPWEATLGLLAGAADVLPNNGSLYLYGPFQIGGEHTAPSNEEFDASLKARDPSWGVRDLDDVAERAADCGFGLPEVVEMPTNNLFVSFSRT